MYIAAFWMIRTTYKLMYLSLPQGNPFSIKSKNRETWRILVGKEDAPGGPTDPGAGAQEPSPQGRSSQECTARSGHSNSQPPRSHGVTTWRRADALF